MSTNQWRQRQACTRCGLKIISGNTCMICVAELRGDPYRMQHVPLVGLSFVVREELAPDDLYDMLRPNTKSRVYSKEQT